MPWYPGATRRPVTRLNPGGSLATHIIPKRAIFHTAVSASRSLFDYFNQPGNPCSHWYVAADGYVEQYVDTDYRAPANLEGNHDCLSWESQDMGGPFPSWSGSNVPAWTAAQVDRLADMSAWVNQTHGIPLMQLPDSVTGRTGFGYHRLGINPWRVPNGELWSNATGKACPGDRRIAQIPTILTNAAQGDDMPLSVADAQLVADYVWAKNTATLDGAAVIALDLLRLTQEAAAQGSLDRQYTNLSNGDSQSAGDLIRFAHKEAYDAAHLPPVDVVALAAELAPLIVAALPPPGELTAAQIQAACEAAVRSVLGGLDTP